MKKFFFLPAILSILISSCHYANGRRVSGNGTTGTAQRNITGFTGVETRGDINIIAAQGSFNVKVEADENLLEYIETDVENGRLMVRFKDGFSLFHYSTANVYVTAPVLNAFETRGSGNISNQGRITDKDKIYAAISGSGNIQLDLDCPEIKTEIHGSGNIDLTGETKNLDCKTSGSGDIKAADLKAENVHLRLRGSGSASVFASVLLDTEIAGSGDVRYKGDPKMSTVVHGSGSVTKIN